MAREGFSEVTLKLNPEMEWESVVKRNGFVRRARCLSKTLQLLLNNPSTCRGSKVTLRKETSHIY